MDSEKQFTNSNNIRKKVLKSQIKLIMKECQNVEMQLVESSYSRDKGLQINNIGGMNMGIIQEANDF